MVDRDAFGRLGILRTRHGRIKTPTVMPVIHPSKQRIPPSEIVESMGASALITNAFLLYKDQEVRRTALRVGIHDYLGVDCPVATDSGGYQIYRGGRVEVPPDEIHRFQAEIGSDMAVVLDVPPRDDMTEGETRSCIGQSIKRSKNLVEDKPKGPLWYGVVHLTPYVKIRRYEVKQISEMPFDIFALGSCVGSLIEYRFESHIDRALDSAKRLEPNRPRHVFGVGHPMFLAISSAFGGDLFDSAMYALAAEDGRYLTPSGTLRIGDLRELPCSCPVCVGGAPGMFSGDQGKTLLARHNLYSTFEELRRVRQAISDNKLWELVQARCRGHPRLVGALSTGLRRHRDHLETVDPLDKKSAFFYSGPESRFRPEVTRARRMLKQRVPSGPFYSHPLYGKVPYALSLCYPFGQTELPSVLEKRLRRDEVKVDPIEAMKRVIDYQFGRGCGEAMEPFEVTLSPKTGRIRDLRRNDKLLGAVRARDFFFLPSIEGGRILHSKLPYPVLRVTVSEEAAPFVSEGKSAFAKFVIDSDPAILPGQEILLVDGEDRLLATGTARMNYSEMVSFGVGVAAAVRHSVSKASGT